MNILVQLDAETYRRLQKVAPAKSRKRSAFIRAAIQKSLWELDEERSRRAYLEMPDDESAPFDPGVWDPAPYGGFDPPAVERARSSSQKRGGAANKRVAKGSPVRKGAKAQTRRVARPARRQ